LQAFRAKAIEWVLRRRQRPLIGWEWLQRETDIFATFEVTRYRPRERPNSVRVMHEKNTGVGFLCSMNGQRRGSIPSLWQSLTRLRRFASPA
jgi:hypothetical protein